MNKLQDTVIKISLVLLLILMTASGRPKNRKFEIKFHLNNIESFVPSYQMAIWLETPDSIFVKTLFLSEYLSYGGYNIPEICFEWSSKAKWDEVTKEEFDAVTGATPGVGDVVLKLECPASIIPEGKYLLFVEVHLVDEYNELYAADLEVTGKKFSKNLEVKYLPGRYSKKTEEDLITEAQAVVK